MKRGVLKLEKKNLKRLMKKKNRKMAKNTKRINKEK